MSNKDDRWSMFKNYMHNELGISKEDVRTWLEEAIQREAEKMVAQSFEEFSVNKLVERTVKKTMFGSWNSLERDVKQEVAKEMVKQLTLGLKE